MFYLKLTVFISKIWTTIFGGIPIYLDDSGFVKVKIARWLINPITQERTLLINHSGFYRELVNAQEPQVTRGVGGDKIYINRWRYISKKKSIEQLLKV